MVEIVALMESSEDLPESLEPYLTEPVASDCSSSETSTDISDDSLDNERLLYKHRLVRVAHSVYMLHSYNTSACTPEQQYDWGINERIAVVLDYL